MIKSPIVLILGAGASNPYGFPLGAELKLKIINNLKSLKSRTAKGLLKFGFSVKQLSEGSNLYY